MSWVKAVFLAGLLLLDGCGGGSGGNNNSSEPVEVFGPERVRVYQLGDVVEFSGTLSRAEFSSQAVISEITVRMEFLENVYSHEDKNVMALQKTITIAGTGEETTVTTHVWQEPNGALFDLNDEYGNYYMNAATNEYGIPSFPVPLMPHEYSEYPFYTMSGGHTSTPITMGERAVSVGVEELLGAPAGDVAAFPVSRTDDYSYLVSYADHKRDEVVVDELVQWVAPAIGVVKLMDSYRRYSPTGALEATIIMDLEAVSTNF